MHSNPHTEQKQKEGMGALSVLISCCCCVLEAVQGSTVIGLLFFILRHSEQNRGIWVTAKWSQNPTACFTPPLHTSHCHPLWHQCINWKELKILAGLATGGRPQHRPLSTTQSPFSPSPNGGIWSPQLCHERTRFWEHGWGKKRKKKHGCKESEWGGGTAEMMPGFSSPAVPGAPKCRVPSQMGGSELRNIEKELMEMERQVKWFSGSTVLEDKHSPDGQLSCFQ